MVRDEVLGHARGWVLVGGGCTDGGCKRHSGVGGRREIVVPAAIGRGRAEPRRSDRSPAFCAKRCSKILRAAELFLKVQARPWARESTKNRFSAHLGARTGTWAGGAAGATGFDVPSGSGSLLRSPPERQLVDGVANVRGKGSRTRVARLSRGTWDELQALRPADALGDDRVFPMTASGARLARPASKRWFRRTSYAIRTERTHCAEEPTSPPFAKRWGTRRLRPRAAAIWMPAPRSPAAITWRCKGVADRPVLLGCQPRSLSDA
jgi:hypothetical protein